MADVTVELPSECRVALKEWSSVVQAFARGEQLVLIRKGGLADPSGFTLASQVFAFYPTYEHQTVNFLRSESRGYFDESLALRPADGRLRLELVGMVHAASYSQDATLLERLAPFHIYNDAFLTQRLRWQPDQPFLIAIVRAFRLPAPQHLPALGRYAGCKSWVDLEQAISLHGAVPVLSDQAFRERLAQLEPLVQSAASQPREAGR